MILERRRHTFWHEKTFTKNRSRVAGERHEIGVVLFGGGLLASLELQPGRPTSTKRPFRFYGITILAEAALSKQDRQKLSPEAEKRRLPL